jgi:hypothetical protein
VTEAEWLTGGSVAPLLDFIQGGLDRRRLRLFGLACFRRAAHLVPGGPPPDLVAVAERDAEGAADHAELRSAQVAARVLAEGADKDCEAGDISFGPSCAARALFSLLDGRPRFAAEWSEEAVATAARDAEPDWNAWDRVEDGARAAEASAQCALLRDIAGNPFRPVTVAPAWLSWNGAVVRRLARDAYDSHQQPAGHLDAARLAVLADALEEAGCADAELLGHLRGPGPHVRGCRVVDLLLGRS